MAEPASRQLARVEIIGDMKKPGKIANAIKESFSRAYVL
jgi:hypothetical protein